MCGGTAGCNRFQILSTFSREESGGEYEAQDDVKYDRNPRAILTVCSNTPPVWIYIRSEGCGLRSNPTRSMRGSVSETGPMRRKYRPVGLFVLLPTADEAAFGVKHKLHKSLHQS